MTINKDKLANAFFNAVDIKKTLESNDLIEVKRVHGGSQNNETLGELIHDVILFLTELETE
jgi:hypothetical protein|tara:strand:+ start:528 stop:710 length:183 start_codon:yes stop_codon:yes gene_type:complete